MHPPAELSRALQAFKKRLKLTQLDSESKLGYGPMTGRSAVGDRGDHAAQPVSALGVGRAGRPGSAQKGEPGSVRVGEVGEAPMAENEQPSEHSPQKLLGNLSVADARHIVSCEGGEQSAIGFAIHFASVVAIAATTAWAIDAGYATVWHLALPMVTQYLALLVSLPVIFVFFRHPDLRKDTINAVRLLAGLAATAAIVTGARAWWHETPWSEQFNSDAHLAWRWIKDGHMLWPMLIAFLTELVAIPGRVHNLHKHGPPFVGVSLGCAMRFVVFMFGFCLLPFLLGSNTDMAWTLWAMILIAELLAFWMLWDLQRRLRKLDRAGNEERAVN